MTDPIESMLILTSCGLSLNPRKASSGIHQPYGIEFRWRPVADIWYIYRPARQLTDPCSMVPHATRVPRPCRPESPGPRTRQRKAPQPQALRREVPGRHCRDRQESSDSCRSCEYSVPSSRSTSRRDRQRPLIAIVYVRVYKLWEVRTTHVSPTTKGHLQKSSQEDSCYPRDRRKHFEQGTHSDPQSRRKKHQETPDVPRSSLPSPLAEQHHVRHVCYFKVVWMELDRLSAVTRSPQSNALRQPPPM